MSNVLKRIGEMGLVPVVVIEDSELAVPTAKAIIEGGLDIMEITMRTEQGIAAIRKIKEENPAMLIGAGTVLSVAKAKEAVDAGAEFIVAPGFNPELVKWCLDNDVPVTPGCATPTEI
jgi:2-dehydro-3-deoxyphosphogluconate aldolase/(4S)-4-hydroxy-2-oxoglutarate aldolase